MGFKLWCCAVVLVSYVISFLIQFGSFRVVYNHLPGPCTRFTMNGSEDMVLYPNNHVLISSGIFFPHSVTLAGPKLLGGVYLMDMTQDSPRPYNLTMVGPGLPLEFNPHGIGHWVGEDGSYYLYVINHRTTGDVVESFEYKPSEKKLVHRKSFSSPLLVQLNDVVGVGVDQFYATMEHYFSNPYLMIVETFLRMSLGCVVYFDGENAMVASENLKNPNGIARSNDGKYIFVNEFPAGQVVAYRRSQDSSLARVQVLPIETALDNIVVDPKTGDLWIGQLAEPLKISGYFKDRNVAVASRCLHVHLNQGAELPFDNSTIEAVLSSSGSGEIIGTTSVCVYTEGRLLAGSVGHDIMMCETPYLMY